MAKIPEVEDRDIFIKTNTLTNMIKGKKIRRLMFDNMIKVEILKTTVPNTIAMGIVFNSPVVKFVFHHPAGLSKEILREAVGTVSDIVDRRHDCSHHFHYVEEEIN
jgi:hypothetical protein